MNDQPITSASGQPLIQQWLTDRGVPDDFHSQYRWLHRRSAELALAESCRLGEDSEAFWARLDEAHDILSGAWYVTAPQIAREAWYSAPATYSATDEKLICAAKRRLWCRHDPERAYTEGHDSDHYITFGKADLAPTIAAYLSRPWLRFPMLDWIFVDMTVTNELISFGEHVKGGLLPGPKDDLQRHLFHQKHKGNVEIIKREGAKFKQHLWRAFFVTEIVIPAGLVLAAFYFEFIRTGLVLLALAFLLWTVNLVLLLVRAIVRFRASPEQLMSPGQKNLRLWIEMLQVWKRLNGPVVNPSLVREEMARTAKLGAVWDTTTWSLIDRVTAIDPAVWIVDQSK